MTLFACVAINRGWTGLGRTIGTSYTCAHPLEAEQHTPLTYSLDFIMLSEIGEPLVHCIELHHLVALVG